jgi:hypothetical protein
MPSTAQSADKELWVIWNGSLGIVVTEAIGRIEVAADGKRVAYLAVPFDAVGPFSLDDLQSLGQIAFGACVVMSRNQWQLNQLELRRKARDQRRASADRQNNRRSRRVSPHSNSHRQHREVLNLPMEGALSRLQIKAAFRRLAQKAHPDMGGSHELFCRITEARNALLEGV